MSSSSGFSDCRFFSFRRRGRPLLAVLLLSSFHARPFQSAVRGSSFSPVAVPIETVAVNRSTALVELFTSEGCSSCPAADELLPAFRAANVYVLEFHVDYWDRLGWKDPFSDQAFTGRQRDYARRFQLSSIYTPEAVVNGSVEYVGSDQASIRRAIDKVISQPAGQNESGLNLSATASGRQITVNYAASGVNLQEKIKPPVIYLALVQREGVSKIGAGENGGRTLRHVNIVRELKMSEKNRGTEQFSLPGSLTADQVGITGWIQKSGSGKILTVAATVPGN